MLRQQILFVNKYCQLRQYFTKANIIHYWDYQELNRLM